MSFPSSLILGHPLFPTPSRYRNYLCLLLVVQYGIGRAVSLYGCRDVIDTSCVSWFPDDMQSIENNPSFLNACTTFRMHDVHIAGSDSQLKSTHVFANARTLGPFGPEFPRLETIPTDSPIFVIHRNIKVLCAADRPREAVELFYHITHKFDDGTNTELVDWLMGFKVCVAALVMEADTALHIESLMVVFQRRKARA